METVICTLERVVSTLERIEYSLEMIVSGIERIGRITETVVCSPGKDCQQCRNGCIHSGKG